jgi:monofunctional glycosyltransferase
MMNITAARSWVRRTIWPKLWRIVLIFLIVSALMVVVLRFINPPTSALFLQRQFAAMRAGNHSPKPERCWAELAQMDRLARAVVASEDQRFFSHHGFDFTELRKAMVEHGRGKRLRGASTITQQVAKNLFLWNGRSYVRKGLEAWFTLLLELFWSKQRILEVYLNIVEFGDQEFGGCAAAKSLMHVQVDQLSVSQAALLAAVLPNPHIFNAGKPSAHVLAKSRQIQIQIKRMQKTGSYAHVVAKQ